MTPSAPSPVWRRPLAVALAWLVLGELIVPHAIAWLHAAETAAWWEPLARALARARERHTADDYIGAWRKDARWGVVAILAYQGLALASRRPRFAERFVPRATPAALGVIRALVAGVLLASALWEQLPSTALLPREMIHGAGVLRALYVLPIGFERFVASAPALAALQAASIALLACAALGWRTRLTVPLAALAYLLLAGILRQYAWFYHTGLVPLYLLAVLAFTPCGDGFSLDRRRRERRGEPVADARVATLDYGWARFLVWTALALPYVEAGLSKLRRGGLDWAAPANLKSILLIDTLNPMQFDFGLSLRLVHAPDAFFAALAWATVIGEIGYGLVLFSRRARVVFPLVTMGMHLGIWLLQNVLFFDLILLQAIFLDWRRLAGRPAPIASVAPARGSWPRRWRALLALLLTCWAARIEEFPFTAMQMYSKPNLSGVIEWFAVSAQFEDGSVRRAPIEDAIPALRDARYRRVVRHGFREGGEPTARAFLAAFAAAHNAEAAAGERITAVEVQRRRWDFARDPDDPEHGEISGRYGIAVAR